MLPLEGERGKQLIVKHRLAGKKNQLKGDKTGKREGRELIRAEIRWFRQRSGKRERTLTRSNLNRRILVG